MKKQQKAFTLIELLLVIGIIATLAGIIWAVMAPAREKARQIVCMSNLRQIGLAMRMYAEDYNGITPRKGAKLTAWQVGLPTGAAKLHRYIKSGEVFLCPSRFLDPNHVERLKLQPDYEKNPIPYGGSYIWHYLALAEPPIWPDGTPAFPPFEEVIALNPEWPIVRCESHGFFYGKTDWTRTDPDFRCLGIFLPDFSVRQFLKGEPWAKLAHERAKQGW